MRLNQRQGGLSAALRGQKVHRDKSRRSIVESLELRRLLSLAVAAPVANVTAAFGSNSSTINLSGTFSDDTFVQMTTSEGTIDLELFDSQAPLTVTNFLSYVNSTTFNYNNTVIYRAVQDFVIQTGLDYAVDANNQILASGPSAVNNIVSPTALDPNFSAPKVPNEFDPSRSNVRGTIAMAKLSGDPNSASTEWFINLADNSSNLDNQNGGFTVFGKVIGNGMQVADTIGNLPTVGGSGSFAALPLIGNPGGNILANNLVMTSSMAVIPPGITYSVTSSNSAVVTPSVSGTNLSLSYGSQPGTANVTVTATDAAGNTVNDVFAVTLQVPGLVVTNNNQPLSSGQTAPIDFGALALSSVAEQTFTVTNNGDSALNLGQITVPDGFNVVTPLPTVLAPGASADLVLAADTSTAGVKQGALIIASNDPATPDFALPLKATVGYTLTLGSATSKKASSITFTDADGTLTTLTLSGPGAITPYFAGTNFSTTASKKGTNVIGDSLNVELISLDSTTAQSKLIIKSTGGDGISQIASLTSTGSLNSITGKSVQFTGDVNLADVGKISIASAQSANLSSSSIKSLSLTQDSSLSLNVSGAVQSIATRGSLAGNWALGGLGKLSAASLANLNLNSASPVSAIAINEAITSSTIRAVSFSKISAGSMSASSFDAGYSGAGLPNSSANLAAGSSVNSLNIKGAFANSEIVASSLGKIHFGSVSTANGGTPFGLGGNSLASLITSAGSAKVKLSHLTPANAAAAVASLGDIGDFRIDII